MATHTRSMYATVRLVCAEYHTCAHKRAFALKVRYIVSLASVNTTLFQAIVLLLFRDTLCLPCYLLVDIVQFACLCRGANQSYQWPGEVHIQMRKSASGAASGRTLPLRGELPCAMNEDTGVMIRVGITGCEYFFA